MADSFLVGLLIINFTICNLSNGLFNLSIPELSNILYVPIEQLADGVSLSALTSFIGAFVAFLVLDLKRQFFLIFFSISIVIVTGLIALNTSFELFLLLFGIKGFVSSFLAIIPYVLIAEITQNKSKYILQFLQILQIINFLISPYVIQPFSHGDTENFNNNVNLFNYTYILNLANRINFQFNEHIHIYGIDLGELFDGKNRSDLYIPYHMMALIQFCSTILLIFVFIITPYKRPIKDDKTINRDIFDIAKKYLPNWYSFLFTILICIILGAFTLVQSNINNSLFNYLLNESDLLVYFDDIVPFIYSFFSTSLIVCCLNIFLLSSLKMQSILFVSLISILFGNCILIYAINYSIYILHLSCILLAIGSSSLAPLLISLIEERVILSNRKMSLIYFVMILLSDYNSIKSIFKHLDFCTINLIFTSFTILIFLTLIVIETYRIISASKKHLNDTKIK